MKKIHEVHEVYGDSEPVTIRSGLKMNSKQCQHNGVSFIGSQMEDMIRFIEANWTDGEVSHPATVEGISQLISDVDYEVDVRLVVKPDVVTLSWRGQCTPGRRVEVFFYPSSGKCSIVAETGTGSPSIFFGRSPWLREIFPELCEVEENYVAVIGHTGVVTVEEDTPCPPAGEFRIQYRCFPRFKFETREYHEAQYRGDLIAERELELECEVSHSFKVHYGLFDGSGYGDITIPKRSWFFLPRLAEELIEMGVLPEGTTVEDVSFSTFGWKMISVSIKNHTYVELRIVGEVYACHS